MFFVRYKYRATHFTNLIYYYLDMNGFLSPRHYIANVTKMRIKLLCIESINNNELYLLCTQECTDVILNIIFFVWVVLSLVVRVLLTPFYTMYLHVHAYFQHNPFKDRLCKVFSTGMDGCFSFEDLLDLFSVMSHACPNNVKANWAFHIFGE